MGLAEQIRLGREPASELLEIVLIGCVEKRGHDSRLPRAEESLPGTSVGLRMFDQIIDKAASSTPLLHAPSERGVEFDATVEKESRHRPMVEPTSREKCLRHRGRV